MLWQQTCNPFLLFFHLYLFIFALPNSLFRTISFMSCQLDYKTLGREEWGNMNIQ